MCRSGLCLLIACLSWACGTPAPEPANGADTGPLTDSGADEDTGEGCVPAPEVCNGIDDDCDGVVDGPDALHASTWHPDGDGDGWGRFTGAVRACAAPQGFVPDWRDCDDDDAQVHPLADEQCNSIDDDCDGAIDEAGASDGTQVWADADGDGFGDPAASTTVCADTDGWVADAQDCDDTDPRVAPGAMERCNGVQDDCADTAWTDDRGLATFTDDDGGLSDLGADLAAATAWTLDSSGSLALCSRDGDWSVALTITAAAAVIGVEQGAEVVLDGRGVARPLTATGPLADAVVQGLTLANGLATDAVGDTALSGGAAACSDGGALSLADVRIQAPTAAGAGGAIAASGCALSLTDVTITDCSADLGGGVALLDGSDATVHGLDMSGCTARTGGALAVDDSVLDCTDCTLTGNTADEDGGQVRVADGAQATLYSSTLEEGEAGTDGGAAVVLDASLALYDSAVTDHTAASHGGAFAVDGSGARLALDNVEISENSASGAGGGLYLSDGATLAAQECTLEGNTAADDGGAIYLSQATATIELSQLARNRADATGGAIAAVETTLATADLTFENNRAVAGAGVHLDAAELTSDKDTWTGNRATDTGGAVALASAVATFTDAAMSSNEATAGGAIWLRDAALSFTGEFTTNTPDDTYNAGSDDSDTWLGTVELSCDAQTCD